MSKIKMRCTTCGKWFQSANAKEVTCPDCLQKARKEKLSAKATQQTSTSKPGQGGISSSKPLPPPPPKPKEATSGTSHWIDTVEDVKVSQPEQPKSKIPSSPVPKEMKSGTTTERPGSRGPSEYRERSYRGPGDYRSDEVGISGVSSQRSRQPMAGGYGHSIQSGYASNRHTEGKKEGKPQKAKAPKPQNPPKPKREKIPPPVPFTPTAEQVAQVEVRYLELAVPTEFDGIRTQIAKELGIPKKAVKKIVKDFRERQSIPSWWELQTYKGSSEELEKIRTTYEPYLPLPPIGVHKTIAEGLTLNPGDVYQAIKAIRLEMNLPQYNDPSLHGLEPITGDKNQRARSEEGTKGLQDEGSTAEKAALETRSEPLEDEETKAETSGESVKVISSFAGENSNTQE
jgi:hypothetical protein